MATSAKFGYAILFCAIFCFTWSLQDKIHLRLQAPTVLELRKHAEVCSKETGVPATHLNKIIDKTLPNDRPNKEFFQCVGLASGFVDKDGHFVLEKVLGVENVNGTAEDLKNTINECNKIVKEDGAETIFATSDCVYQFYLLTA